MRKPRLLALVAGLVLAIGGTASPASAHNADGSAQLALQKVTAEPTAGQYRLTVELADRDSGEPLSFYAVSIEGTGPEGASIPPTAAEAGSFGKYFLTVPAQPGQWTLLIRGNGSLNAGAAAALVVSQAISFTDKTTSVTPSGAGGGGDRGGAAGAIIGVVAALALFGVAGAFLMKRKAERLASVPQ